MFQLPNFTFELTLTCDDASKIFRKSLQVHLKAFTQSVFSNHAVLMSALVDYSSSDDEAVDTTPSVPSRTSASALPPLPAAFRNLYSTNVRTSNADDPELHGGRRRQVAHVEGNWPSHIYTECKLVTKTRHPEEFIWCALELQYQ
jgi:hypothetical protein